MDYQKNLQGEIDRLKQDNAALAAELNSGGGEDIKDTNASAVKTALVPRVPSYIANINDLAEASDSDTVRLAANKLLVEWAITDKLDSGDADANDDFKKLLQVIKTKAKPKS